jgi:hypothetical protein
LLLAELERSLDFSGDGDPVFGPKNRRNGRFRCIFAPTPEANDRQIQRRRRAEFFDKINVRPDATNAGMDRTGRR